MQVRVRSRDDFNQDREKHFRAIEIEVRRVFPRLGPALDRGPNGEPQLRQGTREPPASGEKLPNPGRASPPGNLVPEILEHSDAGAGARQRTGDLEHTRVPENPTNLKDTRKLRVNQTRRDLGARARSSQGRLPGGVVRRIILRAAPRIDQRLAPHHNVAHG